MNKYVGIRVDLDRAIKIIGEEDSQPISELRSGIQRLYWLTIWHREVASIDEIWQAYATTLRSAFVSVLSDRIDVSRGDELTARLLLANELLRRAENALTEEPQTNA